MNRQCTGMKRPLALDLYCGAGGASMGLYRAGFDVVGIDWVHQPNYPFPFIRADVLSLDPRDFDFVWASPPCQHYTTLRRLHPDRKYPDLIADTRNLLEESGIPYVIENVPGAPLRPDVLLCGSMFGLGVRRHRIFESSLALGEAPVCRHDLQGQPIDVSGTGARRVHCERTDGKGGNSFKPRNLEEARSAIGIDWMSRREISQAVPPAYAEWIGRAIIQGLL